jgi:hypothetical protein
MRNSAFPDGFSKATFKRANRCSTIKINGHNPRCMPKQSIPLRKQLRQH